MKHHLKSLQTSLNIFRIVFFYINSFISNKVYKILREMLCWIFKEIPKSYIQKNGRNKLKQKLQCQNNQKDSINFKIMDPIISSFKSSHVSADLIKMSSNFIKKYHTFFNDEMMFFLTEKTIFSATVCYFNYRNSNSLIHLI